ncbi:MAG: hypothetical protein JWP91_3997 [Fibrobacteres bacterium]|nr:hypothetical protein [Fibrobacterota bacterium]
MMKAIAILSFVFFFAFTCPSPAHAGLNPCKFNFGMSWQGPTYAYPAQIDYVTLWTGAEENFNTYWDGAMLNACKPGGKLEGRTPVYYSYIIAFTARRDLGLKDCDVGTPNLCQQGADFIRQKRDRILSQYAKYASETAKVWGTRDPIVWLMEPDYYQYFSDKSQAGGPLTYAEAGALMDEIIATVKKNLPNAVFSMDISPWVSNPSTWFAAFKMDAFTYINTSGGRTDADDARIRKENTMTWKEVHELTRKPIIADDGYGVAGASTGHDATWDGPVNLNARIGDGVVAITQASPKADWNTVIAATRSQLLPIQCQTGIEPRNSKSPTESRPIQYWNPNESGIMFGVGWSLTGRVSESRSFYKKTAVFLKKSEM